MKAKRLKISILGLFIFMLIILTFMTPRQPQDLEYHNFADQRALWGLKNASDVLSNIFIFFVGVYGLWGILHKKLRFYSRNEKRLWILFFCAVILVAVFSAFYHVQPNNLRLALDRFSISLVLTSFTSLVLYERINKSLALKLAPYIVSIGFFSVGYWYISELYGRGDLRFYALVQYGSIFTVLATIFAFPKTNKRQMFLYYAIFFYGAAKFFELYDEKAFIVLKGYISGHTLKHFLSAVGLFSVTLYLIHRFKQHE